MPINKIRRKIHYLRTQPEDVRLRAVSYTTLIGGVLLTGLWATVLLPLQLRLSDGPSYESSVLLQDNRQSFIEEDIDFYPRVGGAQDTPSIPLFHTAPPQENSQGTIVNPGRSSKEYDSESDHDVKESDNQSAPVSDFETIPVEVTE